MLPLPSRVALLCLLALPLGAQDVALDERDACTIGVASGKATADGRPRLWKNRDAAQRDNVVMALADGAIEYFALCDAGKPERVWGGANVKGFAIVNALARDLPQGSDKGPGNGGFMKRALQECANVEDFARLLQATDDGARRTRASFAVIDAHGGAALFEAGHRAFARFDAATEPGGLVLRTNFTQSGGGDAGRVRFERATVLCKGPAASALDTRFLLQQLLRDLAPPADAAKGGAGQLDTRETICRQNTVAALVVHGVKAGEDPALQTMWTVLGQPVCSVAVPLFPIAGVVPRELSGTPRSELCDAARRVHDALYEPAAGKDEAGGDDDESEAAGPIRWLREPAMAKVRRALLFHEAKVLGDHEASFAAFRATGKAPTGVILRQAQERIAKDALKWVQEQAAAVAVPVPAAK